MKHLKYVFFLIFVIPFLAEIILRLSGIMNVYSENIGLGYISPYGTRKTWYHRWPTDNKIRHDNADFNYLYSINKNGLRDKDYSQTKNDSTIRILVTGDSFAEGVGAPYDSTWPRLLEKYLCDNKFRAEVIDAGESGSDIIYDYVFYRDILSEYHPDVVIASMNTSDYTDYYFRGGMERFFADGTVHFRRPPLIEYLYHYSHLFRAIYAASGHPVKGIYMNERQFAKSCKEANGGFTKVIEDYGQLARKNGSIFIFLPHSSPAEIMDKGSLKDGTLNNLSALSSLVRERGVKCIDIISPLITELANKPWQDYTYPNDKHFNPFGYSVFARVVGDSLLSDGISINAVQ